MSPHIPHGSYLIFHHLISPRLLKRGKIVKVKHPTYGLIVKEIIEIDHQGRYWLDGLDIDSINSIEMGAIDLNMITGVVVCTIKTPTARLINF